MQEIITIIAIVASILLIVVVFQTFKSVKDIRSQQQKHTKILIAIAQKSGITENELEVIDQMHDKPLW